MVSPSSYIEPIGVVESPFKQKFGIPRQPGLVPEAQGFISLRQPFVKAEMWRGIEAFSHIWIVWQFHLVDAEQADLTTTVRPPRLGGNERLGVFATRSPFRPNRLALSAVQLDSLDLPNGRLNISGIDMADGSLVFDVKPYVPYADAVPHATGGFAAESPPTLDLPINFSRQAAAVLDNHVEWKAMIEQTLRADPRPAYKPTTQIATRHGMTVGPLNIRWHVSPTSIEVESIERDDPKIP